MSYVGGDYTCDIFVSYSHGDDGLGGAYLLPWSVAFSRELEYELRADRKYRQDLRVFLDKDHRPEQGVDPMAPLTDLLRQKVGESALLVVLMSPDYLASQWCTEERDWWRAHQVKLGLPTEERIAVVRIWPTNQEWPSLLTDARGQPLVGFLFHTQFSNQPRPLGWTDLPGPFGREFRKALLDIIGWLSLKLDAMKARVDELQRQQDEAARLAQARCPFHKFATSEVGARLYGLGG